jgi:hypothetical protein
MIDQGNAGNLAQLLTRPGGERDGQLEQSPAVQGNLAAGGIERGENRQAAAGGLRHAHAGLQAAAVDAFPLDGDHCPLAKGGKGLVQADDRGVGPGGHGMHRQRLMKWEMGAPGFVDHDGDVAGMCRGDDAGEIGSNPVVGRTGDDDQFRLRMRVERFGDARRIDAHAHGVTGMQVRGDEDWVRADQDQTGEYRHVRIPRDDDGVARLQER